MNYLYLYGGAIGDTLLGIHLGRVLAANEPGAKLTMVSTRKNTFARELTATVPFVIYREMPREKISSWFALVSLMTGPVKSVIYEPLTGPISFWWRILLWSASRNGGSIEVRYQFKEHPYPKRAVVLRADPLQKNIFDTAVQVIEAWGVPVKATPAPFLQPEAYPLKSPGQLRGNTIVFHFFAPSKKRTLSVLHAREMVAATIKNFPSYEIVLTCGKEDRIDAERIAKGFPARILENPSVPQLVHTLAGASAYIGVDTGITHLACNLGVQTVVIGNYSNPFWLPTYAPNAIVLYERKNCICNGDKTGDCYYEIEGELHYRCMEDISIDSVLASIKKSV